MEPKESEKVCLECGGQGRSSPYGEKCENCKGSGTVPSSAPGFIGDDYPHKAVYND